MKGIGSDAESVKLAGLAEVGYDVPTTRWYEILMLDLLVHCEVSAARECLQNGGSPSDAQCVDSHIPIRALPDHRHHRPTMRNVSWVLEAAKSFDALHDFRLHSLRRAVEVRRRRIFFRERIVISKFVFFLAISAEHRKVLEALSECRAEHELSSKEELVEKIGPPLTTRSET